MVTICGIAGITSGHLIVPLHPGWESLGKVIRASSPCLEVLNCKRKYAASELNKRYIQYTDFATQVMFCLWHFYKKMKRRFVNAYEFENEELREEVHLKIFGSRCINGTNIENHCSGGYQKWIYVWAFVYQEQWKDVFFIFYNLNIKDLKPVAKKHLKYFSIL